MQLKDDFIPTYSDLEASELEIEACLKGDILSVEGVFDLGGSGRDRRLLILSGFDPGNRVGEQLCTRHIQETIWKLSMHGDELLQVDGLFQLSKPIPYPPDKNRDVRAIAEVLASCIEEIQSMQRPLEVTCLVSDGFRHRMMGYFFERELLSLETYFLKSTQADFSFHAIHRCIANRAIIFSRDAISRRIGDIQVTPEKFWEHLPFNKIHQVYGLFSPVVVEDETALKIVEW